MTPKPIRLGIIGCGAHAHVHANAVASLSDVTLVAACDIVRQRALDFAETHGCETGCTTIEEMFEDTALDGVIICTWPNLHAAQIVKAVAQGARYILCEKALVTSRAEANMIKALIEKHDVTLMEGSMYRHHPAIRKLDRILEIGDLGPLDSVRACFHNYEPEGTVDDWRSKQDCAGGVPYDWMHYLVDSCNHFTGSLPKRVYAVGNEIDSIIYRVYALIEYEGGQVGIIENSKEANFSHALQITCAHGILHLPIAYALEGEITITETHRKPKWDYISKNTYEIKKANSYALQLQNFCDVIREQAAPRVPFRDSYLNALTTEAIVTSIFERRPLDIELTEQDFRI